ncbi:Diacylglycerol kinase [BD1-7 clade bacterium]|uniref:Diacylglycerol kinase n=1 Tax=BD1-7 clade bacterium TaxID=2029982 RepID=A0A5S9QXI1_9GAMM|nr:Diacylglycerol kinase [BD1-7 clade bacterium]
MLFAFYYSGKGFRAAWQYEAAFRQELTAMLAMLPLAFWLGETAEQQILLIAPCILVVIVELINSAIEAVVDRIGVEKHELSGQAKDMGSAAVLCSLLLVMISWGMIGWQRFGMALTS